MQGLLRRGSSILCALYSTSSLSLSSSPAFANRVLVSAFTKGSTRHPAAAAVAFASRHAHEYNLAFSSILLRSSPQLERSSSSSLTSYTRLYAKGEEVKSTTTKSSVVRKTSKRKSSTTAAVVAKGNEKKSAKRKSSTSKKKTGDQKGGTTKKKTTKKKTTKKKMPTAKKGKRKSAKKKADDFPPVPHASESIVDDDFDRTRTKLLTLDAPLPREKKASQSMIDDRPPCVVYWMMRDVRAVDNWALLFARSLAVRENVPLRVAYVLPPPPPSDDDKEVDDGEDGEDAGAPPAPADMSLTSRHGAFLLDGLRVVANELNEARVPFDVLLPPSRSAVGTTIQKYCTVENGALACVVDMSPLRHPRQWTETQAAPLLEADGVPLYQVDAHNLVPVWMASPKREVGARTLRPKINRVFGEYCTHFPEFEGNSHLKGKEEEEDVPKSEENGHDWDRYREFLKLDESIGPVNGMVAGREAAMERFEEFCSSKQFGLKNFDTLRNDPNHLDVCTNLSPWINSGQISFQRLALTVRALKKHPNGTAAYIEEGVVRRELSDNFVYYNPDGYDNLGGAAQWAQDSLELHRSDEREHLYTWKELEGGKSHDDLWNAAQLQLVREGGMHGFMRMYWAKKILEWTISPAYALATAQYFNDRYAYDGNDPNGFVGVGWSIMGIHDMGWKERPIFGKIRYMNYAGCKRKFKVAQFVARYDGAAENAARALGEGGVPEEKKKLAGKKRKA